MKGYGSAWCQHLDPFDSLGEDLNEFIGKMDIRFTEQTGGELGGAWWNTSFITVVFHRRLFISLGVIYNGGIELDFLLLIREICTVPSCGATVPNLTVKYNVCNRRVYLYPCAILNKSNSHSNEDLVSVPQYARVRLSSPRLWGRVGLLEV